MHYSPNIRPAVVLGPQGEPLTLLGLPPRNVSRWTARRKSEILAAINGGLLTPPEACEWYGLSLDELEEWQDATDRGGTLGLRITRSQDYRRREEEGVRTFAY